MNSLAINGAPSLAADAQMDYAVPSMPGVQALLAQMQRLERRVQELSRVATPALTSPGSAAVQAALITKIIRSRLQRANHFPAALFADPAWDMLLDLYLAHLSRVNVSVSALCVASNVPSSTALRWLKILQDERLVERSADAFDKRRHFVGLTHVAIEAMAHFFVAMDDSPSVV